MLPSSGLGEIHISIVAIWSGVWSSVAFWCLLLVGTVEASQGCLLFKVYHLSGELGMLLSSATMTYIHTLHSSSQTSLWFRYMDAFLFGNHGIYSLCQSCALSHYKGMLSLWGRELQTNRCCLCWTSEFVCWGHHLFSAEKIIMEEAESKTSSGWRVWFVCGL